MNPIPVKPPEVNPTVAKSIERDSAFSKPGSMSASPKWSPAKGVRFRSLKYQRPPGRPRKKPRDKRNVIYY